MPFKKASPREGHMINILKLPLKWGLQVFNSTYPILSDTLFSMAREEKNNDANTKGCALSKRAACQSQTARPLLQAALGSILFIPSKTITSSIILFYYNTHTKKISLTERSEFLNETKLIFQF